MTPEEKKDLDKRRHDDFDFMVLCASKGNMSMYRLLRDRSLDEANNPKQGELPLEPGEPS